MKSEWQAKTLGDVCRLVSGQHIDAKNYNAESRGVGYLTGPSDFGSVYPIVSKWTEYPKVKAISGDILITVKGSGVGKINLLDLEEVAISRQLMAVRVTGADPRFVYAFLSTTFEHFQAQSTGAAIPGISREQVLGLQIAVPPPAEQRRIVRILDEAFEAIATAKATAEKNLQNARALFVSELHSTFANFWRSCELVKLSDLASDITDGDHLPPPKSSTGVPFITIGNIVKDTRTIDFAETFMVPRSYFDELKPSKKPKKGDVLYTVTGSFGIPVLVSENTEFCFQRHIGLVRPKFGTNSRWLYYLLLSPQVFRQARDGATGAAQKTVSLKLLRNFEVPKAGPQQQQMAVARLDALSAETRHLECIYERKRAALEDLRMSLLHQAFTGTL